MSIDKAMENGIHCARCVFVTTQPRPSDMYCPWCMKEAQDRIAELEAMVAKHKAADEAFNQVAITAAARLAADSADSAAGAARLAADSAESAARAAESVALAESAALAARAAACADNYEIIRKHVSADEICKLFRKDGVE